MAYVVKVDEREFRIDLRTGHAGFLIVVDGTEHDVEVLDASTGRFTMVLDRKVYTVANDAADRFVIDGEPYAVSVVDEQVEKLRIANPDSFAQKELVIAAPMPGLVLEVMVTEGDAIATGQGLFIVEAMKMQNEMKTPRDGTVKQIHVTKGQTVNSGDKLITIE